MPAFIGIILFLSAITLVVNTIHLTHLRRKLLDLEIYYDIAIRTLALLSEKSVRDELKLLEGDDFLDAAVQMARKQFEEEMEDEDDE